MADEQKHHEIVIIRRGGHGDHDDHHGGVWKIAFADFMTAMMAFFLVMWLISANDKTRASVARYFNPVRLVDATTQPRGLHDSKKDESGITAPNTKDNKMPGKDGKDLPQTKDAGTKEKPEPAGAKEKRLDLALRQNPLAALAEIAASKSAGDAPAPASPRSSQPVIGRRSGAAFRDPFAPAPLEDTRIEIPRTSSKLAAPSEAVSTDSTAGLKAATAEKPIKDKQSDAAAQILASLKSVARGADGPNIDVRRTDEGLLVSLTDTSNFSMFSNGSAVPSRRVVLLMERVAKVLRTRPGLVIVRGFTDSKRFRSKRYDNWHLSLDRAQVTHYMLVRGGLADFRIGHVEGYADRGAAPGTDSANPINRRVEILLKDGVR